MKHLSKETLIVSLNSLRVSQLATCNKSELYLHLTVRNSGVGEVRFFFEEYIDYFSAAILKKNEILNITLSPNESLYFTRSPGVIGGEVTIFMMYSKHDTIHVPVIQGKI